MWGDVGNDGVDPVKKKFPYFVVYEGGFFSRVSFGGCLEAARKKNESGTAPKTAYLETLVAGFFFCQI